jgi:aminopeptidase N
LERLGDLEEHCRNLRKFIDDISLRMQNISFNADTNLALSQARAIHRYSYIKPTSVSYVFHLAFAKQSDYYEGLA